MFAVNERGIYYHELDIYLCSDSSNPLLNAVAMGTVAVLSIVIFDSSIESWIE